MRRARPHRCPGQESPSAMRSPFSIAAVARLRLCRGRLAPSMPLDWRQPQPSPRRAGSRVDSCQKIPRFCNHRTPHAHSTIIMPEGSNMITSLQARHGLFAALLALAQVACAAQPPVAGAPAYDPEARLAELGIELPASSPPVANYVPAVRSGNLVFRSEEHTSELQSLMRNSYAVFCLKKKKQ